MPLRGETTESKKTEKQQRVKKNGETPERKKVEKEQRVKRWRNNRLIETNELNRWLLHSDVNTREMNGRLQVPPCYEVRVLQCDTSIYTPTPARWSSLAVLCLCSIFDFSAYKIKNHVFVHFFLSWYPQKVLMRFSSWISFRRVHFRYYTSLNVSAIASRTAP